MNYFVPGHEDFYIETIILDLNGTLSIAGKLVDGVHERLNGLKARGFNIVFFTGNTRNDADALANELGIEWKLAKTAEEKRNLAQDMNPETCVSIGNGLIDIELMKIVKLSIVTMQAEGVHVQTLLNSDIIVPTILDALDLFLDEQRLIATLRR
ncbi:MAG: haloacid dehalogenase [Candidatus Saccharibacteria bacterium]|nr:haloacid dehalogenase [Candidatus Saccharibacteria bacterium]